jgi:hypothetical protein
LAWTEAAAVIARRRTDDTEGGVNSGSSAGDGDGGGKGAGWLVEAKSIGCDCVGSPENEAGAGA